MGSLFCQHLSISDNLTLKQYYEDAETLVTNLMCHDDSRRIVFARNVDLGAVEG